MKTLKHVLLTLILMGCITATQAQETTTETQETTTKKSEKESDATLEETISWLNNYGFMGNYQPVNNKIKSSVNIKLDALGVAQFFNKVIKNTYWPEEESDLQKREFSILQVKKILISPTEDGDNIFVGLFPDVVFNGKRLMGVWFPEKKKARSLFNALKHLCSFYEIEVKFEDDLALENKF